LSTSNKIWSLRNQV